MVEPRTPTLYVLIGAAGSGKSTFSDRLGIPVVSTDEIRREIFGNAEEQAESDRVFETAFTRAATFLNVGFDVAFDATNTTEWGRKILLKKIGLRTYTEFRKVAILFMTPLEEAKRRNAKRERVVPEDVIDRQYVQLMRDAHTIPDQFDEVVVID